MTLLSTPSGSVRGSSVGTDGTTVHRFLGIPFAGPPSGANRFRPPVPVVPWDGILDCTTAGPAAPQNPESPAPPGAVPRIWSEDACLNLNVWTPGTDGPAKPVMVWIHGGAYLLGANSDAMYDGAKLAAAAGTVVVSINYRLGALGFLHLADLLGDGYEDSSNLALLDQLEALRWVRPQYRRLWRRPEERDRLRRVGGRGSHRHPAGHAGVGRALPPGHHAKRNGRALPPTGGILADQLRVP